MNESSEEQMKTHKVGFLRFILGNTLFYLRRTFRRDNLEGGLVIRAIHMRHIGKLFAIYHDMARAIL